MVSGIGQAVAEMRAFLVGPHAPQFHQPLPPPTTTFQPALLAPPLPLTSPDVVAAARAAVEERDGSCRATVPAELQYPRLLFAVGVTRQLGLRGREKAGQGPCPQPGKRAGFPS